MSSFLIWLVLLFPVTVSISADRVTITVTPLNLAPIVNAGPDATLPLNSVWTSVATASDDGLPNPPGQLTLQWAKISGPGVVAFTDAKALNTTATFSVPGVYVLELIAMDTAPVEPE